MFQKLKKKNLFNFLKKILKQKDSLSICVGMQLFFNSSEEGKFSGGFKYIDKKIVKFDNKKNTSTKYFLAFIEQTKKR